MSSLSRPELLLWTGADGDGKTYLAQAMTAAIASGDEFLGMTCQQAPVLYLDLENPAYTVQTRMQAIAEGASVSTLTNQNLRVWGIWNEQQPPVFVVNYY